MLILGLEVNGGDVLIVGLEVGNNMKAGEFTVSDNAVF